MAITVREVGRSRGISESIDGTGDYTRRYWASGSQDIDAIETAVLAVAPTVARGMMIDSYSAEAANDFGTDWFFDVRYSRRKVEAGSYRIGFDTTGGTVRITNSFETTSYPKSGETAPDYKGAIQVRDGRAEGIDVVIPVLNINVRATIVSTYVTAAYLQTLSDLTGRINNSPFLGWSAGEVLFLGTQGEFEQGVNLQLTFNFAVSRNVTGLTIGDIDSIDKNGHDYLWVVYEPVPDTAAKRLTERPKAVYVERVYETADFGQLYIGVT